MVAGGLAAGSLGFEGIEEAMLQRASDAQKRASGDSHADMMCMDRLVSTFLIWWLW